MTDALQAQKLQVPSHATLRELERAWMAASGAADAGDLEIDMSGSRLLEIDGLAFLISKLVQRRRASLASHIRLPAERGARSALRDWRFPEAVSDALSIAFHDMVTDDDRGYFGEPETPYSLAAWASPPVLPRNHFPFRTFFAASRDFGYTLAAEQAREWQSSFVLSVLNRRLGGLGRRISTHVVHEAMMNAIRHPNAAIVQTVASHRTGDVDGPDRLSILVWDDGVSIVDTLLNAQAQGHMLRPWQFPRLHRHYDVTVEDELSAATESLRVYSGDRPSLRRDLLLLSSTFPGITSDPDRPGRAHGEITDEDEVMGLPGMGLYVLANTVVDVFSGQLVIRTAELLLELGASVTGRRTGTSPLLRARIVRYAPGGSYFTGNLLIANIPIARDPRP